MTLVQIACLKPEKALALRYGNHPECTLWVLCFHWEVLAKGALDALVAEGHRRVLWDCFSKHLLHSRLPL